MANRTIRTNARATKFVKVLAHSCNVSEACRAAGIGRSSAYEWREADPEFAAAWEEAEQEAADKLEREAWRRAVEGTDKPVIYQGEITDTFKEYSDRMLEVLLKAHKPKYRDKQLLGSDPDNPLPAGFHVHLMKRPDEADPS